MASLPVVGTVDWKWFIIGVLAAMFVFPFIMSLVKKVV